MVGCQQQAFCLDAPADCFFETIQLLLLSDLRAQRKPQAYATSTVFRLIVILGASYWFIVVEQMGLVGVFFGRMSGDAAGIFFLSLICLRETKLHLSVEIISPCSAMECQLFGAH